MRFKELDVVRVKKAFPERGVVAGEVGAVVLAFSKPYEAYEVEFVEPDGTVKATFAIRAENLEKPSE